MIKSSATVDFEVVKFTDGVALSKVYFALVVHSHQPVGNFDHVIEEAYQKSYHAFLEVLFEHPRIRFCLHTSGVLFEWIEKRHPDFFKLLGQMVDRGQVELVGGGYYEPILLSIPEADRRAQIHKMADYLKHHFGVRPKGAWVTERVWEQSLTRSLAEAGVDYVILDDTHFLAAGLEPSELRGTFVTEESGVPLHLVPSLKSLRYTIPFSEPEDTLRILRSGQAGTELPASLLAMGDDCEKFGVWPGTFEHVYKNGWLERFLKQIESAADWLETTTLSDYLAHHAPLSRIYLPSASYEEMMEWALPTAAAREFKTTEEEIGRLPSASRIRRFLRGGIWLNFFSKYSEANQLQKLMLEVSRRWHAASEVVQQGAPHGEITRMLGEAQEHLLASQCNDAYWHGVFGGLYAPHLRSGVTRNLIQAEVLLDKIEAAATPKPQPEFRMETRDFDIDGQDEVLVEHPRFAMVVRPADGGTISSLRYKPGDLDLINSMMRRPEAYHEQVLRQVSSADKAPREGPASIHEHVWSKESNLSALLRYDRYSRNVFRTYLFSGAKQCDDFDYFRLDEDRDLASGAWASETRGIDPAHLSLKRQAQLRLDNKNVPLNAAKTIQARVEGEVLRLDCRSSLTTDQTLSAPLALGLELVLNLLAPDAPDRYFLANGVRRPLEFRGEIVSPQLVMIDEWQQVKILVNANPEPLWWIVPIETISQSESGFERVYQGSAILAVWKIEPAWRSIACDLSVEVEHLSHG